MHSGEPRTSNPSHDQAGSTTENQRFQDIELCNKFYFEPKLVKFVEVKLSKVRNIKHSGPTNVDRLQCTETQGFDFLVVALCNKFYFESKLVKFFEVKLYKVRKIKLSGLTNVDSLQSKGLTF